MLEKDGMVGRYGIRIEGRYDERLCWEGRLLGYDGRV